jgi:methylmalonyl-CoA/ethylmalonyl-CoA epimerase
LHMVACHPSFVVMDLTEVDHVGIAVRDLEAAVQWHVDTLGVQVVHREVIGSVEEALLKVADSYIQLMAPMEDDSPLVEFLDRRGEGIHHIAYRVDDCAAALRRAIDSGAKAMHQQPRPGSRGTTVAFLHPDTAFGMLIELVEEGPSADT